MSLAKGVVESLRSPTSRAFLKHLVESSWHVGFGRSLDLPESMQVVSVVGPRGSVEMTYKVPQRLCIKEGTVPAARSSGDANEPDFLPCGVTLALMDEVSLISMAMTDRTHRPGVSLTLSCEMHHPVGSGETVTFKSEALKMGARIGYSDIRMYRADGKLAARGRHIKYLPMGRFWDMSMNSIAYPLLAYAIRWQHAQIERREEQKKGVARDAHLVDMFKIHDLVVLDASEAPQGKSAGEDKTNGSPATTLLSRAKPLVLQDQKSDLMRVAEGKVDVTQQHVNYIPGTFHGGAIAISAEEIARRCPPWLPGDSSTEPFRDPRVRFMEVHYMSSIKQGAGLAAVSTSALAGGNQVTQVGISEAGDSKRGVLCAEALLFWGEGRHKEGT